MYGMAQVLFGLPLDAENSFGLFISMGHKEAVGIRIDVDNHTLPFGTVFIILKEGVKAFASRLQLEDGGICGPDNLAELLLIDGHGAYSVEAVDRAPQVETQGGVD